MPNYGAAAVEEVQPDRCNAFAEALANAGQASIDAFLNSNRHQLGFKAIGKGAIAQVLLDYENKGIPKSDDDWLDYLFKVMLEGLSSPEEFIEQNKIGFITFNYDRLLEMWLFRRIKYSFGLDDMSAFDVLRKIPIHHVYGMLGSFQNTPGPDPHRWINASKGIRTIFDTEHDQSILNAAKALLGHANTICLLGFGFHRENIELLDLATHTRVCKGLVVSSRYDISDTELARLTRPFSGVNIRCTYDCDKCLETFRGLPIF